MTSSSVNVSAALAAEGVTLEQIKSEIVADGDARQTGGISYPNEQVSASD